MNVLSAFVGITAPVSQLHQQIASYGWEVGKVQWDQKQGKFTATAKSPHGQEMTMLGPDDATALAHLLAGIARHTHMRTAAQWKLGMWKTMFTDQLPQIAEAYAKAPVYDAKAAACFKELADDSVRRAEVIKHQIHVEVTDNPEPYANAKEMADDIHQKRHFWVSRANSQHPLWTVDQNIAFRTVHDVLGHAVSGGDFGWQGENLACAAHFPLLTTTAQQALFTECIAQTAYAAYYRSFGPQKVALFPEFTDPSQAAENSPGHSGIHPQNVVAPSAMPTVTPSPDTEQANGAKPEGAVAPHMEGLGLTPMMDPGGVFSKFLKKYAASFADPNSGWSSGTAPMQLETHGVGNAYLDHGDPIEAANVMDNASLVDTKWQGLTGGDGTPDRARMKQAIVNAFRVVLLSPRKDLRWNAIHYQDIAHVPAETDDPKAYWDALESRRRSWNQSQGIDPDAHMVYFKYLKPFESVIFQMHPELGHEGAKKKAEDTLFAWWSEEQQRIEAEDEKKPAEKQRPVDEIERRANEALAKRMQVFLKDKTNKKTDVHSPEPMSLFAASGDQYNLLTGEPGLKYGAFMGTHLKAISQISRHADEILDAAVQDVRDHDGTGHHFRARVLSLGVSGVGPKVCSFAWLLLQPMTSQLATIDTHMMDVLGHNYEKEMSNRDYFKFERELAAGRDASGYGHVPLGAFQWGMWDHKRTGPGSHQDHSAMRVLDPVPHSNIDWASKAQPIGGGHAEAYKADWASNAPDWWRNTQGARDAVAADWDKNVAPNFPRSGIPYQVVGDQTTAQRLAKDGSADEFHVGIGLPEHLVDRLSEIAKELGLKDPEDAADYHITAFWAEHGYDDRELHEWIRRASLSGFRFENARIDCFPSQSGGYAIVLRLDGPEAKKHITNLMREADDRGLDIKKFEGGWKAHITLGYQDEEVEKKRYPDVSFRAGPLYVSVPRPLRTAALKTYNEVRSTPAFEKAAPWVVIDGSGETDVGAPGESVMQFARLNYPGLSTPEIWKLLGEKGGGKIGNAEGYGSEQGQDFEHV